MTRRLERDLLAAGERVARVSPKMMAHIRDAARPTANLTRSTPWPWRGQYYVNPSSRWLSWTARTAMCVCWSTIAKTSSPNAPGRSADCAGTYTNSTQPGTRPLPRSCQRLRPPRPATARHGRHRSSTGPRRGRPLPSTHPANQRARSRDHRLGPTAGSDPARHMRVRIPHRCEDPRGNRRDWSVPLTGGLRPPHGNRTAAGLVVQSRPPPSQPRRQ